MKLTRYLLAVALAALTTGAHAQAISALTGASALSGSEVTAVVQSATTKKATVDQFRTYILGGNTWTAGTGTLTLGAGKTATISNTLTFAGTDGSTLNVGTGGTLGTAAYTASSAYEAAGVALLKASNLSDLTSASTARTNLGLGTLATQSGTFSGTSSGTNTGDQTTITGNAGTATALQTARAIYGNNFDGSAALTQVIASTFGGTGNGFTKFTGPTTAERTFTLPDSSATLLYSGGAAGTPSSITLTNGTALPSAGITMSTARLLGRTTASSGAAEEITVGAGLSLSAGTLTATGGSVAIGDITGLGTNVATALGVAVGSDGAFVTRGGNAGTPSALVCTNCTGTASGLTAGAASAVAVGGITGLGTGVATALAVNVGSAGAPVLFNGAGGTPSSIALTNGTGLPPAGVTGTAAILTGNAFTGANTTTLSVAATSTDGHVLQNTTAAAAGAQQWSPRLRLTGQGWKTTATAASQSVDWIAETLPIQGTANPTSWLVISSQVNGGGYTQRAVFDSGGGMSLTSTNPISWNKISQNLSSTTIRNYNQNMFTVNGQTLRAVLQSAAAYSWSSTTDSDGTPDLLLTRSAAATLQQGAANAASPVNQVLRAQGSRAGSDTNVAGANYAHESGQGTGNAAPSSFIIRVPVAVASGTGAQTMTDSITVNTALTLGSNIVTPASSGTRYLCIDTGGVVTSSASACSGT